MQLLSTLNYEAIEQVEKEMVRFFLEAWLTSFLCPWDGEKLVWLEYPMKVCFVYISLSGNTESFVRRLSEYLVGQYPDLMIEKIHVKDLVKEGKPFFEVDTPFITFLPTYLEGGNGVDNGDVEILTTDVADFIAYGDNATKCLGVVGSGNRNFNNQYCLTAKQYSQRFGFPVLADFEMRGMLGDIKKVAGIIEDLYHF